MSIVLFSAWEWHRKRPPHTGKVCNAHCQLYKMMGQLTRLAHCQLYKMMGQLTRLASGSHLDCSFMIYLNFVWVAWPFGFTFWRTTVFGPAQREGWTYSMTYWPLWWPLPIQPLMNYVTFLVSHNNFKIYQNIVDIWDNALARWMLHCITTSLDRCNPFTVLVEYMDVKLIKTANWSLCGLLMMHDSANDLAKEANPAAS